MHYQYLPSHRGIHDLFVKRLNDYREKFHQGLSIENDLYRLLSKWLINHIQHDDQDYVDAVRDNMIHYLKVQEQEKARAGLHGSSVKLAKSTGFCHTCC